MPSAREILAGLTQLSQTWKFVAVFWHVVLILALIAIAKRYWWPTARSAALAAAAPLASAAAFAWIGRNPFNGAVLSSAAIALVLLSRGIEREPLRLGSSMHRVLGASLVGFGFVYPHFVDASSPWLYLFVSPLGLIPCPSLSILVGVGLCCEGFGSRAWALTASTVGLFYGGFGVARLGVWMDAVLFAGAAALALQSLRGGSAAGRLAPSEGAPL